MNNNTRSSNHLAAQTRGHLKGIFEMTSRIVAVWLLVIFGVVFLTGKVGVPNALAEAGQDQASSAESGPSVGESFLPYSLEDQFKKPHALQPETRRVIMSANMELSKELNKWLSEKDSAFLDKHKTEYVSDITEMPGIITWLFARPKMQKYGFRILLADDENFHKTYGLPEDKITVFDLDGNQKITAIHRVDSVEKIPPREVLVGTNYSDQMRRLKGNESASN